VSAPARPLLGTLLIAAGLTFAVVMVWGLLDFRGPFRWLAEWQIRAFGGHWSAATVIVPLMLVACPLVVMGIGILGNSRGGNIGCLSLLVLMALGTLLLGIVLTTRVAQRPTLEDPLQQVDVASLGDAEVGAAHAELIGHADNAQALVIRWRGKTATHQRVYTPVLGPAGGPVRFVAMTEVIDPQGAPQPMADNPQGILLPGGLPNEARAGLARRGVVLAPEVHLLDASFQIRVLDWMLALGCTLAGAGALLLLGITARRSMQ
jgi:hypothetical protein